MIIFLYGPDSYRRQKKLKEVVDNYKQKHSLLSVDNFDLENPEEIFRLKDFLGQRLIFEGKKAAVVENSFNLADKETEVYKNILKDNSKNEENILFISENDNPPEELKFILKDAFNKQEFKNLDDEKMIFFVRSEAKKREFNLSDSAVYFLAAVFKNNTWGLITELDKLQSLHQRSAKIDVSDLERGGDFFKSSDILNFINAVSRKRNTAEKLKSLENLFSNHEEPAKIFNFLAANRFLSFDLLKKMADYDVLIKSGRLDYETALLNICLG